MRTLICISLAFAALLTGCASNPNTQGDAVADASYTPLGSYIPKKGPSRGDNVTQADKQALENDRVMGNGVINPQTR